MTWSKCEQLFFGCFGYHFNNNSRSNSCNANHYFGLWIYVWTEQHCTVNTLDMGWQLICFAYIRIQLLTSIQCMKQLDVRTFPKSFQQNSHTFTHTHTFRNKNTNSDTFFWIATSKRQNRWNFKWAFWRLLMLLLQAQLIYLLRKTTQNDTLYGSKHAIQCN